eukprot:scaffold470568_cov18-Prasinocladus_malaysianus.AAC.1
MAKQSADGFSQWSIKSNTMLSCGQIVCSQVKDASALVWSCASTVACSLSDLLRRWSMMAAHQPSYFFVRFRICARTAQTQDDTVPYGYSMEL